MKLVAKAFLLLGNGAIIMNKFTKLYDELFEQGCKPNQATILAKIFDRMESSRQRTNFYSDTYQDYFVIYTYEELANELNLSTKTIANLIKQCVAQGYLTIELMHNRVNQIFMTNKSKKIAGIDDLQDDTVQNAGSKKFHQGGKIFHLIKLNNYTNKNITDITENHQQTQKQTHNEQQINALMNTLLNQVKLPKRTTHYLKELSFNDPNLMYHYVGLLLKAKHNVTNATKRFKNSNASCLMFDDNTDLSECLNNNVYGILMKANKHGKNRDRYIMGAFINMFKEYYNQYAQNSII